VEGGPCCGDDFEKSCNQGLVCGQDSRCHRCGNRNEACCLVNDRPTCNGGLACTDETCQTPVECGTEGKPCCGGLFGSCNNGLRCTDDGVRCERCGQIGMRCCPPVNGQKECANEDFNEVCLGGVSCQACGRPGQICCHQANVEPYHSRCDNNNCTNGMCP